MYTTGTEVSPLRPAGREDSKAGTALVTVMCMVLLLGTILSVLVRTAGTHARITRRQVDAETAFFVAEAACERAAQEIANGASVPASFAGAVGAGTYVVTVISGATITDSWHSVGGTLAINPNNSPNNEFTLTRPDGGTITRDTLTTNYPGYIGQASYIRVRPKGGSSQTSMTMDGQPLEIDNNKTYEFVSDYMSASVYNDNVDSNGVAMGKWYLSIAAAEANVVVNGSGSGSGNNGQARIQYSILGVGNVRGQSKVVLRETVRQKTWAKYALWMSNNNGIYFISGEKFYGAVHSNERLNFSGNPEFFGECTSATAGYGGSTNACIFHQGFQRPVSNQTMAGVSFSNLQKKATLLLDGRTYVRLNGTNMLITNERKGWNNAAVGCESNTVVYIRTVTTGTSSTRAGDLYLAGVLDGRLTFVCERDTYITNHVTYAVDSKTNLLSDDALGIVVKRDIAIVTTAPNNLKIYAHMMATGQYDTNSSTDGSFGVVNYDTGPLRGYLTVHGGIVQADRGAVGTFSASTNTGYLKNYTYDTRFENDPPPEYPPLNNELVFGSWRER